MTALKPVLLCLAAIAAFAAAGLVGQVSDVSESPGPLVSQVETSQEIARR